jgi:Acyltransferase family
LSIWSQAKELAAETPDSRNRYVDFLRAASILFVISGHWLMTTAYYDAQSAALEPILALDLVPWAQWITWAFQVMPIFFMVGGYSNAVSLDSARKNSASYPQWLTGRLHRLLTPLMVLVFFWALVSLLMRAAGSTPETIALVSKTALVPTWFLAIYTMIVLLAPLTYAFWRRWGYKSLFVYIALAVLTDMAFFLLDLQWLGWTNYFWVWLAVHHLGFAWYDGRQGSAGVLMSLGLVAFAVLVVLIVYGPYPVAMAGSPGEEVSNTLPPKITLIALGMAQFGLLLALEKPMQALLRKTAFWASTIIINTMIMTIYLWHMTVLLAVMASSYFAGGVGLQMPVGSPDWWISRPLWLLVLLIPLVPAALLLSPLERISRADDSAVPSRWRLITGSMLCGMGIVMATLLGFNGDLFSPVSTGAIVMLLLGAWLCGLTPAAYFRRSSAGDASS